MAMVDATAVPPEGRNGGRFGEHPREHHWPCAGRCSLCPPLRAAHDRHGPPHAVCRVAHMVPGPAHMPPVRAHVSVSMRARAAQYTRTWRGSARPSSRRDRRTIARRFIAGAAPAAVAAEVPKGRLRGAVSRPFGTLGLVGLRRGRSPALKRWAIVSRPLGTATPVLQDSEEIPWGGIAAWEFSAGEEGGARRRTSGGTRLDLSPQEGVTDMPDRFAVHKERGMVTLAVVDRVPRPPARR